MSRYCTYCGAPGTATRRSCRECGTDIIKDPSGATALECSECGGPIHRGWRHCPRCGVDTPVATSNTTVTPDQIDLWLDQPDRGTIGSAAALQPDVMPDDGVELISRPPASEPPTGQPPTGGPPVERPPVAEPPAIAPPVAPPDRAFAAVEENSAAPGEEDESESVPTQPPVIDVTPTRRSGARSPQPSDQPDPTGGGVMPPTEPPVTIMSTAAPDVGMFPFDDGSAEDSGPAGPTPARRIDSTPGEIPVAPRRSSPVEEPEELTDATPLFYREPGASARISQWSLAVVGVLSVIVGVALFILNVRTEEANAGTGPASRVTSLENLIETRLVPALIVAGVIALIAITRWTHDAYINIFAFGLIEAPGSPALAASAWLVPVINLVVPPFVLNIAWRGADVYSRDNERWRQRPGNGWVNAYAVALVLAVATVVVAVPGVVPGLTETRARNLITIGGLALLTVAMIFLAAAVTTITRRQQRRIKPGGGRA